jgi:Na+-driven multidrug efflux pump
METFTREPNAIDYGVDALRIMSYSFGFMGLGMVAIQAFNGAGDTMTPTWINGFCYWLVQIPLAYLLAMQMQMGPYGVFWAVFTAEFLMGLVGLLWFLRGSWKTQSV